MTHAMDHAASAMPDPAPLELLVQDFKRPHPRGGHDRGAATRFNWQWRVAVFLPALVSTGLLIWAMEDWLSTGGLTFLKLLLLFLIGTTFIWVSLSVSTVTAGLLGLLWQQISRPVRSPAGEGALSVALLVPIYNEVPWNVYGNAAAIMQDLAKQSRNNRYTLFILSDTRDPVIAEQEWAAFWMLREKAPESIKVYYRRRAQNTDQKVGNLGDWITNWGADYEAMLVLDADSLMSGRAIQRMTNELAYDPTTGLIQSFPVLIGAETLFARIQQFSNVAYGWLLGEGLALWSQREGNYWGHNAIIRTRAFAESAGLPYLKGRRGEKKVILSHDFVEAGLLRRAGWAVRFMPRMTGSYEETPSSLIDYVLRDRRWCQGNLQHLRLLATRGLHPVSRFHLFHGAVSYLLSPAWFILLVIWALLGKNSEQNVIQYFNESNPLYPVWPEISQINSAIFLVFMYSMLMVPKFAGAMIIAFWPRIQQMYGGRGRFLSAFLFEVVVSITYAPILMVQQTLAVIRSISGITGGWKPQNRGNENYPWPVLIKFHALETVVGAILTVGLFAGLVSIWLSPIAASLLFAVPLSALSSLDLDRWAWGGMRLDTPHTLREPPIVARAREEREEMHRKLTAEPTPPVQLA